MNLNINIKSTPIYPMLVMSVSIILNIKHIIGHIIYNMHVDQSEYHITL